MGVKSRASVAREQALTRERGRRLQLGADAAGLEPLEAGMIELLTEACRFCQLTGHVEKAVSIIQAALEFHCFAPALSGAWALGRGRQSLRVSGWGVIGFTKG